MDQSPLLSVIIVNWNVEKLLERCLNSLYASWQLSSLPHQTSSKSKFCDLEVIVVDNASADESVAMVKKKFPDVRLIVNKANVGYPAGCNVGLRVASGQYLLVLNPDTQIVDDALSTLVGYMQDHPQVGMVGPMLTYPDGTHQSSRRRFPTLPILFLESTWWEKLLPRKALSTYYCNDCADTVTQEVDWVTGAAMMIQRGVLKNVGGLDERFFMYSEELDWCQRIKKSNWHIHYLPQAVIIHHEGKSSEQAVAERHIYFHTSKILYTALYHGTVLARFLHHWLRLQYVLQILFEGSKWLMGHKRALRQSRISAYKKVLKSRFISPHRRI